MATKTETIQDLKNESLTPRSTAFLLGHTKEEQEFFDCFKLEFLQKLKRLI